MSTVRVAMMFPAELKDHLQKVAGPRNMTNWVLNAIYDKLEERAEGALDPFEAQKLSNQLKDARKLAQELADAIAATDDDPNPQRVLQSRSLPDWLDQNHWPTHLKSEPKPVPEIKIGEPALERPASVYLPETDEEPGEAVNADTGEVAQPREALPEEPFVPSGQTDDFLARTMAKAKELGLTPASQLPVPPKPELEPEPEPEKLPEPNQTPVEVGAAQCESCGSELVEGECWWCN